MSEFTFHLVANAHLDPVWLWDWQEGLNEGLITCRTILDLMDEDPELTFVRGESAIYQHIDRTDPVTFERIRKYVKSGRWDVVGGTVVQPDTNLPATETLSRQFVHGQRYFTEKFGKPVRVAWAADSFGHAAGLPEILASAGITGFAFTRPLNAIVPLDKPAFWWEGPGGSRVLGYRPLVGWYGSDRNELPGRLDETLAAACGQGLHNVGLFYGMGNHGGGPTRAMLRQIRDWAQLHPDIAVIHSGLHRLFDALRAEIKCKGNAFIPTHRGEMNYVLRGCYSSVAKFKFPFRRTEALLSRAETTDSVISAHLNKSPATLRKAWDAVLFNSFHDILPGTSIERAYTDQLAWLGSAYHDAQTAELTALNQLAARVDTRVTRAKGDMPTGVAAMVWNPHPRHFNGYVELEAALDYRFIDKYYGNPAAVPVQVLGPNRKPIHFQLVATEHSSLPKHVWRKRAVIPIEIEPMGWTTLEMGWVEKPRLATPRSASVRSRGTGELLSKRWRVVAKKGGSAIHILRDGKRLFGQRGLSAVVYEDPFGCWGDMKAVPDSNVLTNIRETWSIEQVQVLESGPLRATLWVRLAGRRSSIEFTIALYQGRDIVDVSARVMWNERSARLKLVMPGGDEAEYDVPGASVQRGPAGEVPGGRWVRVQGRHGGFGFASDALYNFDASDGVFRATVVRASRYAASDPLAPGDQPWLAAIDAGELTFKFLLTHGDANLPSLAGELRQPPVVVLVPPSSGDLPRQGSLASLAPASLELLAFKPAEDNRGLILRIREATGRTVRPTFTWMGQKIVLDRLPAHRIGTWRLSRTSPRRWRAQPVTIPESTGLSAVPNRSGSLQPVPISEPHVDR